MGDVFEERRVEESADTARRVERTLVITHTGDVAFALADSLGDETHETGQERTEEGGVKRHAVYRVSRLATWGQRALADAAGSREGFDRYARFFLLRSNK